MDWKNLGEDAELKLKMDLEQPSSLMALISILKSKGVLTEEDMTAFNERQKYIQNLMFETSKAVGMVMVLQEEGEDILVHSVTRADALALLAANRVPNGHTLIALQWLQIHGDSLRERWS